MRGSLLRNRDGHHAHVGFVELFFDLVFVFAITQISHTLLAHLSWTGALHALMLLMAVWWAWNFTSWVTNWLDPETTAVRLALFALMAAGLVMSSALPDAFDDKGLVFACAFVAIQVGRTLFMLWAARDNRMLVQNFQRILAWLIASAVLWIVGGLVAPEHRLWFWLAALAVEYAAPALYFAVPGLGRATTADWTVEGGHLAERVGLFVIICLGETLLITGATFAELAWTPPVIAAFASALLMTVAMWWLYFSQKHDAASERISHSDDTGALARRAYTYAPILLIAGIIVAAVGDELVLAHPAGHIAPATALVMIGGPLLFLFGSAVAVYSVWGRWPWARLAGCAVLAALGLGLGMMTPLLLTIATTAVLLAVAVWETLRVQRS
jgi:low temperature requirement protein LtrA